MQRCIINAKIFIGLWLAIVSDYAHSAHIRLGNVSQYELSNEEFDELQSFYAKALQERNLSQIKESLCKSSLNRHVLLSLLAETAIYKNTRIGNTLFLKEVFEHALKAPDQKQILKSFATYLETAFQYFWQQHSEIDSHAPFVVSSFNKTVIVFVGNQLKKSGMLFNGSLFATLFLLCQDNLLKSEELKKEEVQFAQNLFKKIISNKNLSCLSKLFPRYDTVHFKIFGCILGGFFSKIVDRTMTNEESQLGILFVRTFKNVGTDGKGNPLKFFQALKCFLNQAGVNDKQFLDVTNQTVHIKQFVEACSELDAV